MPTNDPHSDSGDFYHDKPTPSTERREPSPGYETTDVNVGGVIVFLSGLAGFLLIFFVFCFVMGKVINSAFLKQDGPATKWNKGYTVAGGKTSEAGKREDLANNPEMQQRELAHMSSAFPSPRLQMDDGNQDTADLHAREDLLLDHASVDATADGLVRIPITRAMQLVAERGLPVASGPGTGAPVMLGDANEAITAPITNGFARTSYELDTIEARAQKMSYGKASGAEHAELKPAPGAQATTRP